MCAVNLSPGTLRRRHRAAGGIDGSAELDRHCVPASPPVWPRISWRDPTHRQWPYFGPKPRDWVSPSRYEVL